MDYHLWLRISKSLQTPCSVNTSNTQTSPVSSDNWTCTIFTNLRERIPHSNSFSTYFSSRTRGTFCTKLRGNQILTIRSNVHNCRIRYTSFMRVNYAQILRMRKMSRKRLSLARFHKLRRMWGCQTAQDFSSMILSRHRIRAYMKITSLSSWISSKWWVQESNIQKNIWAMLAEQIPYKLV